MGLRKDGWRWVGPAGTRGFDAAQVVGVSLVIEGGTGRIGVDLYPLEVGVSAGPDKAAR